MKDSSKYSTKLKRLCTQIKKDDTVPAEFEQRKPLVELLLGCLSEHTTESKAITALHKLETYFVDFNELRVARLDESIEALGKTYPHARDVATTLSKVLKSVQDKLDELDLDFLLEGGKRDAKSFLEELEGVTPYIVAWVMLRSLGAHAFPVNEQMMTMLREEEVISPNADVAEVQGFLERQISASKISETYALLRHYADNFKETKTSKSKKTTKTTSAKKTTKKTTKKKTTKKRTTK